MMIAPVPGKTRAKVPMNSAAYFLAFLIQTFRLLMKIEMRFANALDGSA